MPRSCVRTLVSAALAGLVLLLGACSPRLTPFATEAPRIGAPSPSGGLIEALAPPQEPVVVAVYRFRDQTGQYRALENVSTFSTAVTQGATSILVETLESSGWFVPIEREGLSNLLNERQIISSTRQQFQGPDGQALGPLPPLLYAGILLEGGIVGYDSNVLTGGAGVRYLGTGGSSQFRQDQVTVSLRAVSVQNGRVLKAVRTTKTIVSQKLDGGLFRFVDLQRLLETEVGYSANEPPVLAVTAAIEEAVAALVIEGIRDGLWQASDASSPEARAMFDRYDAQLASDAERDVYDRLLSYQPDGGPAVELFGGGARLEDDYTGSAERPVGGLAIRYGVGRGAHVGLAVQAGQLQAGTAERAFVAGDLHLRLAAFPSARVTPYLLGGLGLLNVPDAPSGDDRFLYATTGAGLELRTSPRVGLSAGVSNLYPFVEGLDGLQGNGGVNDNLWGLNVGITYYGL